MDIYFVRHGQSNYNVFDLCYDGLSKKVFLTNLGKKQAENAAQKLKNKKIDAIFCSQLWRTRQTANIINRYHSIKITLDKKLNERKMDINGKSCNLIRRFFKKEGYYAKPKNGESFKEIQNRVISFLKKLKKMKHESVVIVSHEDPIKFMLGYLRNYSDKNTWKIRFENARVLKVKI